MRKSIHSTFAAAVLWLCAVAYAHADGIGSYPSSSPAIAFDPGTDTGLVVYESGGRIYAKRVDNNGVAVPGSDIAVFPRISSSSLKYKDPAIVFKTPQNRYYIAARQSYPTVRNFPDGPVTFDTAEGIEIVAFDRQLARLADRTLYSPGFLRNPFVTNAEAKPAIVADNVSDATCCIAVVWQDARQRYGFFMSRMNPDLGLFDPTPRLLATTRSHVANLSATYDASGRDRFVFAYDACNADARYCVPFVGNVPAYASAALSVRELPRGSDTAGGYAYPDVAYVPGASTTVAAWGWSAAGGGGVYAALIGIDSTGAIGTIATRRDIAYTPPGCYPVCVGRRPNQRPDIIPIGSGARVMIVAPSRATSTTSATSYEFTGFNLNVGALDLPVTGTRTFSASGAYFAGGRGAYSISGRVIAAWDQGTIPHSIWAGAATP